MPLKDPEKRRAYTRAWYASVKHTFGPEVRAKRKVHRQNSQRALRTWYVDFKSSLRCNRCGEDHPGCLVFHHEDPTQKEFPVSIAVKRGWGRERILREIEKCEVLCANCHVKHHAKERAAAKVRAS